MLACRTHTQDRMRTLYVVLAPYLVATRETVPSLIVAFYYDQMLISDKFNM